MTSDPCHALGDAVTEIAVGAPVSAADQAHLDTCAECRAELALARRIERVLATWPTPAPPAYFAAAVSAAARRETWRQEQVVDWGFNVALAVGLAAIGAGLAGALWVVGATAGVDGAQVARSAVSVLLDTARAQATVVGTATLLLGTTVAAWWWAEERARW